MGLYEGVREVAGAGGEGPVDWNAVVAAARAATGPGDAALSAAQREAYAADARAARDAVGTATDTTVTLPDAVTVQDRHHWIGTTSETLRDLLAPLEDREDVGTAVRRVNTGAVAATLAYLARNVLGQYDPGLFGGDPALYVVHPNVERAAASLAVDPARFRRWIVFHEVAHAAEFSAAPWLADHLSERARRAVEALRRGDPADASLREIDVAMTAVEGYAELLMDRAFDRAYADMRRRLDRRRRGGGPLTRLLRRLFGVGTKRRQYERGVAFFEHLVGAGGMPAARAVWAAPENLPTDAELDDPDRWLARVQYST